MHFDLIEENCHLRVCPSHLPHKIKLPARLNIGLGQGSAPGGTNTRQVYQLVQVPAMPPAPNNNTTTQPPTQEQHDGLTRSTNAGSAFGS